MYIIAEGGINANGSTKVAAEMTRVAKDCGADAIKWQLYDSEKLLEPELASQVKHCDWDREQWEYLVGIAQGVGIDISASVFDLERLEWLKATDPPWYKVASRIVRDDDELLTKIIMTAEPDKVYISLGCFKDNVRIRFPVTAHHIRYMLCKAKYPAKLEYQDVQAWYEMNNDNVYRESLLWGHWGFVGFSSHTGDIEAPLWAIAHGATVIEVHFSLDKSQPGVDQSSSIEPDDLRTLCRLAPEIERLAAL